MRYNRILLSAACLLVTMICLPSLGQQAKQSKPDQPLSKQLAESLKSSDLATRIDACRKLSRLGSRARGALPQLIEAARSENQDLARCALLTIGGLGADGAPAIDVLVAKLGADDSMQRAYAAHALGRIGPGARRAARSLAAHVTDDDATARRAIRDALRRIDAPKDVTLPIMVEALQNASPADATGALLTLAELGEQAVPGLCEALQNEKACYWACLVISEIGPKAEAAVPHLAKLLDSKQVEVRMQALIALGQIGPAAQGLTPQISKVLSTDPIDGVRYAAAFALGSLGQKELALDALSKALSRPDAFLKVAAAWAILKLDSADSPTSKKAAQVVITGLSDQRADVRTLAARALSDESFTDSDVGDALRLALEGIEDPDQLMEIAASLATVGPRIVPLAIQSLEQKRKLRYYAIQVLRIVGSDAAAAVPVLTATLDDANARLRREAAFALGAIGTASDATIAKLVQKLADPEAEVQYAACYALGKMGPAARVALPELKENFAQEDDSFLRLASVWAAVKIAPGDNNLKKMALPALVKGLGDRREHVRLEVVNELADFGPLAMPALDAVRKATRDPSEDVRKAAKIALKAIKK